jgi:predicted RNase H-like HicB family nuclease
MAMARKSRFGSLFSRDEDDHAICRSYREAEQLIREAVEFHFTGLREDGVSVPQPSSQVEYIEVAP